MGLFNRNYDKPGPGVQKDEPRKKGAARFFELLIRDFWDMVKLNILLSICVLPSLVLFVLGFLGFYPGIAFILCLLLSFPIGGALVAYIYNITRMMRDDPSYVWYEFKRKFKENYLQAAPVGMLCSAFILAQILLWVSIIMNESGGELVWLLVALVSLVIFGMITPYIFLNFAYIELTTLKIIKNSILMSFGYLPRSFAGVLMGSIMWIVFALFFPVSMTFFPLIALFGLSISMLLTLMWVWPPFDNHFKIEETLIKRVEEENE